MSLTQAAALTFFGLLASFNLLSIALAGWRIRPRTPAGSQASPGPVSLVVPCRGLEAFSRDTLRAAFTLNHPDYELIFCVAHASDPIVPVIRQIIADHPNRPARLLIGNERFTDNPKLNNCAKGWHAARHEWIVLADSNVLMPHDYLARLLAVWRMDTGLVCSPPVGSRPQSAAAVLECSVLNTLQARWQYTMEALGMGFAQGKSMLWRRSLLESRGGIAALAGEIAEDAAATKVVREAGGRVRLVDAPFEQPLGSRTLRQVWDRQVRWARLRRVTFPHFFVPEILSSTLLVAAGLAGALHHNLAVAAAVGLGALAATYGSEALLAWRKHWHLDWRLIAAMPVRDALIPAVWMAAWMGRGVVWHGEPMSLRGTLAAAGKGA